MLQDLEMKQKKNPHKGICFIGIFVVVKLCTFVQMNEKQTVE